MALDQHGITASNGGTALIRWRGYWVLLPGG
jgi:hypothetical protein